jgi:hypothetical protein
METIETVAIGCGQAGLAVSYHLSLVVDSPSLVSGEGRVSGDARPFEKPRLAACREQATRRAGAFGCTSSAGANRPVRLAADSG